MSTICDARMRRRRFAPTNRHKPPTDRCAISWGPRIAAGFVGTPDRTQVSRGVIPDLSASDVLLAGGACLLIGVVLAAITAAVTLRAYVRL